MVQLNFQVISFSVLVITLSNKFRTVLCESEIRPGNLRRVSAVSQSFQDEYTTAKNFAGLIFENPQLFTSNQGSLHDIASSRPWSQESTFDPIVVGFTGVRSPTSYSHMAVLTGSPDGQVWTRVPTDYLPFGPGQLYTVSKTDITIVMAGRTQNREPVIIYKNSGSNGYKRSVLPHGVATSQGMLFGSSLTTSSIGYVVGTRTSHSITGDHYYDVSVESAQYAAPLILRTSDSGATWTKVPKASLPIVDQNYYTTLRGVASMGSNVVTVGWYTVGSTSAVYQAIWYSTDSGATFLRALSWSTGVHKGSLYDVSMASSNIVYACGADGGDAGL